MTPTNNWEVTSLYFYFNSSSKCQWCVCIQGIRLSWLDFFHCADGVLKIRDHMRVNVGKFISTCGSSLNPFPCLVSAKLIL